MLSLLCSGTLVRDPQERQSTTGKTFASAAIRVPCEGAEQVMTAYQLEKRRKRAEAPEP